MKPPQKLYKYDSLTLQTLLNLKQQIIYFGSPLGFNDPYDCALTPNIEELLDEDVEMLRQQYLKIDNLNNVLKTQLTNTSVDELKELFVRVTHETLTQTIDDFLKNKGVACFSEKNDDLLMWSHYGGKYRGICLEFDTEYQPFEKIKKVQYVKRLPQVSVASVLSEKKDFDHVEVLYCTKSQSWEYEREWRAIHHVAGTKFCYPAESLTGIYFGPDIDKSSLEICCLILKGQNKNVRFFQGRRSTSEFHVEFEEFNYLSHLEATEAGLKT